MRLYIILLCFISCLITNAQISPILDHTWTIEKIIKEDGQTLMADLYPSGVYDTFKLNSIGILDNLNFYQLEGVLFGHCEMLYSFNDISNFALFYHPIGCLLSNDDSSDIALYFNEEFIFENTPEIIIDNEFFPFAFGPLSYSFITEDDIIYLDITNPIGEVARFYAPNLSQDEFLRDSMTIYPNPTIDVLSIESSGVTIEHIKIYDLNGRLVEEAQINQENQINVSQLQKGVYILHIETAVGLLKKKFVKE